MYISISNEQQKATKKWNPPFRELQLQSKTHKWGQRFVPHFHACLAQTDVLTQVLPKCWCYSYNQWSSFINWQ